MNLRFNKYNYGLFSVLYNTNHYVKKGFKPRRSNTNLQKRSTQKLE